MRSSRSAFRFGAVAAVAAFLAGCVDTEKVFVDIPLYEDPPTAAQGFLGYTNSESKLPVCGNCHVGQHSEWKNTVHATAWEGLQSSDHAAESCENCHTVGPLGNPVTEELVGWAATKDARYQDVQCESCHGPGLEHVTNPDADTKPLAQIKVGTDLTSGCGECHQDTHHPFVEEWSASRHANTHNHASENESCGPCHEARGIFEAWGVNAVYLDQDDPEVIPIVCAVCHDPHDPTNSKQLRFPINVANVESNLCMKCHHRRAEPDPNSSRGPHAPQGPLLIGEGVGWVPPNFVSPTTQIVGTHGSSANPRLCATCHVTGVAVTDPSGAFIFNATGHLFQAIPCLDAQGVPTAESDCDITERSFASCSTGGCHGSPEGARGALIVARTRIEGLAEEVNELLSHVPSSEFRTGDGLITTGEGAKFNASLALQAGNEVHNPFLIEALLIASIKELEIVYGLSARRSLVLDMLLGAGK